MVAPVLCVKHYNATLPHGTHLFSMSNTTMQLYLMQHLFSMSDTTMQLYLMVTPVLCVKHYNAALPHVIPVLYVKHYNAALPHVTPVLYVKHCNTTLPHGNTCSPCLTLTGARWPRECCYGARPPPKSPSVHLSGTWRRWSWCPPRRTTMTARRTPARTREWSKPDPQKVKCGQEFKIIYKFCCCCCWSLLENFLCRVKAIYKGMKGSKEHCLLGQNTTCDFSG